MSELEQLVVLVTDLHRKVDALTTRPAPHLTRVQFAKLAGISRWTVAAKIDRREIRTERGRIPRTELAKFVS